MGLFDFMKKKNDAPIQEEDDALEKAKAAYAEITNKQPSQNDGEEAFEYQDEMTLKDEEYDFSSSEDSEFSSLDMDYSDEKESEGIPQVEEDAAIEEEKSATMQAAETVVTAIHAEQVVEPAIQADKVETIVEPKQSPKMQPIPNVQEPPKMKPPIHDGTSNRPKPTFEDMLRGQAEYIHSETVKVRTVLHDNMSKTQQGMRIINERAKSTERKVDSGFAAVKTSSAELNKKADVASEKIEKHDQNMQRMTQQIMHGMNVQAEQIVNQVSAAGRRGDADLNRMTPMQHYRNIKYSVFAFVFAVLGTLLCFTTFMRFIGAVVAKNASAIIIVEFLFVMLAAGAAIVASLLQKKVFYPEGKLKDFIKSKNPAHEISKVSFIIGAVVGVISLFLFVISIIVVAI